MLQSTWRKGDDNCFGQENIVFNIEMEIVVMKYTFYIDFG